MVLSLHGSLNADGCVKFVNLSQYGVQVAGIPRDGREWSERLVRI